MSAPLQINLTKDKQTLRLSFADMSGELSAELMRVESPSAEVQGHGDGDKRLVSGKKNVQITDLSPIGNYALQVTFSDGHKTGFFTWDYLHNLCENKKDIWETYLASLKQAGQSREDHTTKES